MEQEQEKDRELLQEIREEMMYVNPVGRDVRFVNYFVDQIAVLILVQGMRTMYNTLLPSMGQQLNAYLEKQDMMTVYLIERLIAIAAIVLYYTLFEASTQGRTFGKLLTGTVAVTQTGAPFTTKHAFLRTLCRLIPFEAFSAFGRMPWHDSITKTTVVKKTW